MQNSHRMGDLWHQRFADMIIKAVCELPDRTSPHAEPDMMLVKIIELQSIITEALGQLEEKWTKQGMLVLPGWAIVSTKDLAELAMRMPPPPFTAQDGRILFFADPQAADRNNQIGRYFRQMLERTHEAMEDDRQELAVDVTEEMTKAGHQVAQCIEHEWEAYTPERGDTILAAIFLAMFKAYRPDRDRQAFYSSQPSR